MKKTLRRRTLIASMLAVAAAGILASCSSMGPMSTMMYGQKIALSGSNEVPPNGSAASGTGTVTINPDRSVTATITVTDMTATASHIHEGAAGANGPVIVPFAKTGDNTFAAAEGAKLTESQYASYKAGNLYVNVHSAKNPGGEIRAQLKAM
jgi:CHRD domain